jgi:hypothetical protein
MEGARLCKRLTATVDFGGVGDNQLGSGFSWVLPENGINNKDRTRKYKTDLCTSVSSLSVSQRSRTKR